ncbi:MAG: hypothetical protein JWN87_1129 [Frankiales bacterium]|nr:hypothetical protein [Frankiales bacterium]
MPEPTTTFGLRALVRGVPRPVWACTALFGVLLSLHALLTPLYRAPDEARHVDTVLSLRDGRGYPPAGEAVLGTGVLGSYPAAGYSVPRADGGQSRAPLPLTGPAPDVAAAPSFRDVTPPALATRQLNQMTQHPPLYYAAGAAALWLLPGDQDLPFPYVIGLLRLLSVLCLVPLPLLAFAAARRLLGDGPAALAAAAVPLAVPQLLHIGGSVSNDNLLTLLLGVLTVALVHVSLGDTSRRTAVTVGLLAAAALLTKGFALLALPWLVLAYGVAFRRARTALTSGALALALSALGGWWYVLNLVRYGELQPEETIDAAYPPAGPEFAASLRVFAEQFADKVSNRFWGNFGYLEVPLPSALTTGATVLLLLLVAIGLGRTRPRAAALLLLLPAVGIGTMLFAGTYDFYRDHGVFPGLQGRYLFPALVGLAVLVGSGAARLARGFAPAAVLLGALLGQAYALRVVVTSFWPGGALEALRHGASWSWAPAPVVVGLCAGAAVLGLAALALLGGTAVDRAPIPVPMPESVTA